MRRIIAFFLCFVLAAAYLPYIGEESHASVSYDDWNYSLTMPEESYDCIEETTLYRYNDPEQVVSADESLEGYEFAGKKVISRENGPWMVAQPENELRTVENDVICEQKVEKKSVHYSFAYMDTAKDWFWLIVDARHYVKYMDEDKIAEHELTGECAVEDDYAVCLNYLQIFSENDIAGFDNVDDLDHSKFWCAQTEKTINLGNDTGGFGEVYLILYDGEPIEQFVSGSKKELAYVWGSKDTSNPDVRATEQRMIYRLTTEKYQNVFTRDNWSSWSETRPEEKQNRVIETEQGYRYKNKTGQKIAVPSSVSKTYGCSSFNLNASAKTPLTYKSSNASVATVSNTGVVSIKNPGIATITVTAAETNAFFAGSARVTIKASLKTPVLTARKASKTSVKLSWTSTPGARGYQIYKYSPKKKKYVRAITKSAGVKATTNKKLKRHRRHYYKIRAYRIVNGKYVYSSFSTVKSVKL